MDITKAKKVYELSKDNRKILVTLWGENQISSCVEEEKKQYCETCQGNEELCRDYVEHLKNRGYSANEIELGELEVEESLPRFLEERERDIMVAAEPSAEAEEGEEAREIETEEE